MRDCDVLICGLGPVGQLLALLLGDRGVRTVALDREHEPYALPRAAVIDAVKMELEDESVDGVLCGVGAPSAHGDPIGDQPIRT